jgi:hypothetical protein
MQSFTKLDNRFERDWFKVTSLSYVVFGAVVVALTLIIALAAVAAA